jgi:hypothetical protein
MFVKDLVCSLELKRIWETGCFYLRKSRAVGFCASQVMHPPVCGYGAGTLSS